MSSRVAFAALSAALLTISATAVAADEIRVGGTGAAQGILQRLGEAFSARHPGDKIEVVRGLGSSGGISAVAEGALHLSISSRALKADEKAQGIDSVPVLDTPFLFITSHSTPQKLTKADVVSIYDGSLMKWPDGKEIKPVLRPKSDSASSFLIANFEGMQAAMDKLRLRPDVPVAATDQDNVEAAEKISNSFAGGTLIQFVTEAPRLRPITLDGIDASVETMEKGAYPLKVRMHAVTKSDPHPSVQRFISFLRSPEAEKVVRQSGGLLVSTKTGAAE